MWPTAQHCIFSSCWMSLCFGGYQTAKAYSKVGCTIVVSDTNLTFGVHCLKFLSQNLTIWLPLNCCYILIMGGSGEVTDDVDAQALAGTCCFLCLPMEEVARHRNLLCYLGMMLMTLLLLGLNSIFHIFSWFWSVWSKSMVWNHTHTQHTPAPTETR